MPTKEQALLDELLDALSDRDPGHAHSFREFALGRERLARFHAAALDVLTKIARQLKVERRVAFLQSGKLVSHYCSFPHIFRSGKTPRNIRIFACSFPSRSEERRVVKGLLRAVSYCWSP